MPPYGYHWTPCPRPGRDGGWLVVLAVLIVLVLAAAAAARQAAHVLGGLIPWICGAIIAAIASGWLGYAALSALRARSSHARARQGGLRHIPAVQQGSGATSAPRPVRK
jgi:hypothetical protein